MQKMAIEQAAKSLDLALEILQVRSVADFDEAFRRYLGLQGSAYVARPHFHPEEAIALIHGANGVSVLAHPGPMLTDATVQRLVTAGLRGIEVWHPLHGSATIRRYRELVRNMGLIETGGSPNSYSATTASTNTNITSLSRTNSSKRRSQTPFSNGTGR